MLSGMVYLEFQDPVAACLHKSLQDRGDTILRPGQVYDNNLVIEIFHKR